MRWKGVLSAESKRMFFGHYIQIVIYPVLWGVVPLVAGILLS